MIKHTPGTLIGIDLATSALFAARFGMCGAQHRGTEAWKEIYKNLETEHASILQSHEEFLDHLEKATPH
jgi:hypothetical protein